MNQLERIQREAQESANRSGKPECVLNLNRFSALYVIRNYYEGIEKNAHVVSIHYPEGV